MILAKCEDGDGRWPVHRERVAEKSIIVINGKDYPIMC